MQNLTSTQLANLDGGLHPVMPVGIEPDAKSIVPIQYPITICWGRTPTV